MMNKVVDFSIHNRVLVVLFSLFLVGFGLYAAVTLPIDAVPDTSSKTVMVNTAAPALAPEEIERQIPDVVEMRSISQFGLSQVTLVFADRTDIHLARQMVTERLGEAREQFPPGAEPPELAPIATGLGEVYYVFVEGEGYSLMQRREICLLYTSRCV